jgi:hypothetical protein
MNTVEEIIKEKRSIEKQILELLRDFQKLSKCQMEQVNLEFTSNVGTYMKELVTVELKVSLPRA